MTSEKKISHFYKRIHQLMEDIIKIISMFVHLFSWRYNPLWLYIPLPGSGLYPPRFGGFLITHNDAPQSVGLLWTSNQSVAEAST
jgi:hypothetical protein